MPKLGGRAKKKFFVPPKPDLMATPLLKMEWDENFSFSVIHNNTILQCQERREYSGKLLGGLGSAPNPAIGDLTVLSQTSQLVGRGLAAPSQELHPCSRPSASIFGPSGLIQQPPPIVFISPNAQGSRYWHCLFSEPKNAPECRIFLVTGKETFSHTHPPPCPPAKCRCPSTSSRLATALIHGVLFYYSKNYEQCQDETTT